MSLASYRPDETDAEIFSEHTWLQGAFLGCVFYGMEFILFAISCNLLWSSRHKVSKPRRNLALILYVCLLFLMGTLYIVALMQFNQQAFIDGRNIPGGPNAYQQLEYSLPIDMVGNAMLVVVGWFCDIINLWRCYVIYQTGRVPAWIVIVIPALMYLASMVLGLLWLKQVGFTGASPWAPDGINFTTPYLSMALALNIFVTLLIVSRLVLYHHRLRVALGKSHTTQYTSLAAMLIESATIYSLFSLLFLVPFGLNNALAQVFLQALSPVQVVSTLLIIFRVAQGKGWSVGTMDALSGTSATSAARFKKIHTTTMNTAFTDTAHDSPSSFALKQLPSSHAISFDQSKIKETV